MIDIKTQSLITGLVAAITCIACGSKDNILSVRDGAANAVGGATTSGVGGAVETGSGGAARLDGGWGGLDGTGGVVGSGGTMAKDAGASDSGGPLDAVDAPVECAPGYPVGSTRPKGDGCNTCTCQASGVFACTFVTCPVLDAGLDGTPGVGGAGGGAGGAPGSGGSGGGSGGQTTCPSTPPQSGAACDSGDCAYEDCAGAGRTSASCRAGAWVVETSACSVFPCGGLSCAAGQLCMQQVGGALLSQCVSNTCGKLPISCSCLDSCVGTCSVLSSPTTGTKVSCSLGCTDPRGCP